MIAQTFQLAIARLYPELGGSGPDTERYAESIIVRVLNTGTGGLQQQMLDYYGLERVRTVALARVNRLDAPVYRAWRDRLGLPARDATVERMHALWRR